MGIGSVVCKEWKATLICVLICFAALQFGYDSSYFSGIQVLPPFLSSYGTLNPATGSYSIPSSVLSLVTSIINIGEFLGAVSSFFISDKIGLKNGLYFSAIFILLGVVVQVAGDVEATLIVGRLLLGYAVGLISCFVPLYVADCAPAAIRGLLVSAYQLFIGVGLLIGVLIDYGCSTREDTGSYRIPMAVQLTFPVVFLSALLFLAPESPRWLYKTRGPEAAQIALQKLNSKKTSTELQAELELMQTSLEIDQVDERQNSWRSVFTWGPEGRKAYLGFALQALQQASGVNFITSYGVAFFFAIGIDNPFLIQVGLYLIGYPALFASSYLIERFGRRSILMISGFLVAATCIIMGSMGLAATKTHAQDQVVVAMVYLFIFFFNIGWGPTVWVVCSEISTGPNRGKLMSVSTGSNWSFNWLVSFTFPYLFNSDSAALGPKVGFIYGALMLFACIWVFFFLPETAGRNLEEIDEMFEKGVPAREFSRYEQTQASSLINGDHKADVENVEKN